MNPESQQFDDHLHGEDHREDHVEDVHDGGEELGLLVVLGKDAATKTCEQLLTLQCP